MSKSIIDKLIVDKLQGLNFEFKAEYWDKMHEQLNAECAQTNTCTSTTISGFLSGSLLVTLFSIIGIIIFFPWEINNSTPTTLNQEASVIEKSNSIISSPSTTYDKRETIKYAETEVKQEATSNTVVKKQKTVKAKTKKRVAKKTRSSKKYSHKASKKIIASTATVKQKEVAKNETIAEKSNTDSLTNTQDFNLVKKEDKALIKETTLELEDDSVVIADGRILDDQKEIEEKDNKVIVQAKPVPVKRVKTRRKPNKRVFKKHGILYRLGLRK